MAKTRGRESLTEYAAIPKEQIDELLEKEVNGSDFKIVVLDDDPTGVQTVHGISVYTDWDQESLYQGFMEQSRMFFVLTNSRSFTEEETKTAHRAIAKNVDAAAKRANVKYILISRGDSTLRGHYPLETELLREEGERLNLWSYDGEILCPFFREGGRFTMDDIHYVQYDKELIPAGETEFAKDQTFGYVSSDLKDYIEEKTEGRYLADQVVSVSIESLRALQIEEITQRLCQLRNFQKMIVNAVDEYDVKVFCIALYRAMKQGRHYLFRTAAAFIKALGNISDKPLLDREELTGGAKACGGIIVVGSHTQKTTRQLEALKSLPALEFLEMDSDLVLVEGALEQETKRVVKRCEEWIRQGITVVVSTKRQVLTVEGDTKEEALRRSVKISDALQAVVGTLMVVPGFVVAKGGITSSDVGTKALRVKRALVLGQICPGVPVWRTGQESRFPGIPYVIFPGNVGFDHSLREAVEKLI